MTNTRSRRTARRSNIARQYQEQAAGSPSTIRNLRPWYTLPMFKATTSGVRALSSEPTGKCSVPLLWREASHCMVFHIITPDLQMHSLSRTSAQRLRQRYLKSSCLRIALFAARVNRFWKSGERCKFSGIVAMNSRSGVGSSVVTGGSACGICDFLPDNRFEPK